MHELHGNTGFTRKCKEARRVSRALSKNRHRDNGTLLHEIDSALTLAKGFLFNRGSVKKELLQYFSLYH